MASYDFRITLVYPDSVMSATIQPNFLPKFITQVKKFTYILTDKTFQTSMILGTDLVSYKGFVKLDNLRHSLL